MAMSPNTDLGFRFAMDKYTLDGTENTFEFNFVGGYISKDHVYVETEDANHLRTHVPITDANFVNANTLQINGLAAGLILIIRRVTPINFPIVDYVNGAILNESNLNLSFEQCNFAEQEAQDMFADILDQYKGINEDVINVIGIAQDALDAANNAISIANTAVGIANNAVSIANNAVGIANNALAVAQDAVDRANQAIADAQNAIDIANGATVIANNAVDIANTAVTKADQAIGIANDAKTIAQDAYGAADAAAQSASDAAQSAADAVAAIQAVLNAAKQMEIPYSHTAPLNISNENILSYLAGHEFKILKTTGTEGNDMAMLLVAATTGVQINISKNGITTIGTILFGAGQIRGTINIVEDIVIEAKASLVFSVVNSDATAAGLAFTINGFRTD